MHAYINQGTRTAFTSLMIAMRIQTGASVDLDG